MDFSNSLRKLASSHPLLDLATDVDRHYPIHQRICDFPETTDIFALSQTCKRYSSLYSALQKTQWNVNCRLAQYFTDPRKFRTVQGATNSLVCGNFPERFFARAPCKGPLHIYALTGNDAETMQRYLKSEGYDIVERAGSIGTKYPDAVSIWYARAWMYYVNRE